MFKKNNDKILKPNSTIGIFGGGQLGRMACGAAHELGYRTIIFSDVENSPASFVTNQTIVADYADQKALQKFADQIDIATFEFENIPVAAVEFVAAQKPVYPSADVLKITQNRLHEKDFLNQIGVKTADYLAINSLVDLQNGAQKFSHQGVLKTTTMGYDGKGQQVLKAQSDLKGIWENFSGAKLILEKFVDFSSEISVIVARNIQGEIACYQPLTNIHKNGILDRSFYPAKISAKTAQNAVEIASSIAHKLDLIGILAVEFFVLQDGNLLVNELAPRPHNSGHFSMDASNTSQFEQLIRAISGLPLGDVDFHCQGHMQNLIGEDVLQIDAHLENKKAKLHLYGKDKIAAGRKMGHINFLS
ncbi:MAG: 5-(carboxyamino)imidazole ribonucleotide synthase [Pseudomonadota bacterium]